MYGKPACEQCIGINRKQRPSHLVNPGRPVHIGIQLADYFMDRRMLEKNQVVMLLDLPLPARKAPHISKQAWPEEFDRFPGHDLEMDMPVRLPYSRRKAHGTGKALEKARRGPVGLEGPYDTVIKRKVKTQ